MAKSRYSIKKKIQMLWWMIRTKMICKKARIIRFPIDIRGAKYIDFGNRLTTGVGCRIEAFPIYNKVCVFFGEDVQINDYVHISAMESVRIGDRVLMAGKIYISDNSHGIYKGSDSDSSPNISPIQRQYNVKPVLISENVWIGENVVIMPGVTIGIGSIIGANAVVTKSIPSYSIAVGNPAKVIKQFNFEKKIWEKIK